MADRPEGVAVIPMEDVTPIDLPGGSWSRLLLTGEGKPGSKGEKLAARSSVAGD
mgnify:CR=1 FL=1